MGLGDDLASALAAVMPILRGVERLVAFDNRMTDFSVFRVVRAVQGMARLTHLGEMLFSPRLAQTLYRKLGSAFPWVADFRQLSFTHALSNIM